MELCPLADIDRVIADPLQVLCDHQVINAVICRYSSCFQIIDDILLNLIKQIINHIISCNDFLRAVNVHRDKRFYRVVYHPSRRVRHLRNMLDHAAALLSGLLRLLIHREETKNQLRNIRRVIADPLHVRNYLQRS